MKSFIVVLILIGAEIIAQTPDAVAPLAQNNYWVYLDNYISDTWKTIQVIDTAKYVDSIKYYELEVKSNYSYNILLRLREDGYYVMRRDTSFPGTNHEQIYYKKDAQIGDQWQQALGLTDTLYFTLLDTAEVQIWNKTRTIKLLNIRNYGGLLDKEQIWSEEFGKLSDDHNEGFTDNLIGCIIDNVLFGDTTITGVEETENNVTDYRLSQNYPNPFNSTTNIEYEISSLAYVNITVFNSIGESVANLVNEIKPKGRYKIKFNAYNLPSGIYFYRLTNGTKTITNKMVLLK